MKSLKDIRQLQNDGAKYDWELKQLQWLHPELKVQPPEANPHPFKSTDLNLDMNPGKVPDVTKTKSIKKSEINKSTLYLQKSSQMTLLIGYKVLLSLFFIDLITRFPIRLSAMTNFFYLRYTSNLYAYSVKRLFE